MLTNTLKIIMKGKTMNEAKDLTIEQVNQEWEEIRTEWKADALKYRTALGVTPKSTLKKVEETEQKLRSVWQESKHGFTLTGFKVTVQETVSMYPVNAWLMFTPTNGEEMSWDLSTRFGGVLEELMNWIHEEVGVEGVQLEMKLPMTHQA